MPKTTFARQSSCAVTAGLLPRGAGALRWTPLPSLSFRVCFLPPLLFFCVKARRANLKHFTKPKARAGSWGPAWEEPLSFHFSPPCVCTELGSQSSHFAHPGSRLLEACKFGQVSAAFPSPAPHSWLNILPVSSPAVLGCRSSPATPLAMLAGKSLVLALRAQPRASSAVGDLHCVLLSLSEPKAPDQSKGRGS